MTTDHLLTADQAAAWLTERGRKATPGMVRYWLAKAQMPGRKLGGSWLISEPELRRWLGFEPAAQDERPATASNLMPFVVKNRRRSA